MKHVYSLFLEMEIILLEVLEDHFRIIGKDHLMSQFGVNSLPLFYLSIGRAAVQWLAINSAGMVETEPLKGSWSGQEF